MKRTDYCGALREKDLGRTVTVMGWTQNIRDMGGIIFVDLRDREGILQVVLDAKELPREQFSAAESLRNESVLAVSGRIRVRDEETVNPKLVTGTIELRAAALEVLSVAEPLPFQLEDADSVREDLRLRNRFLDLRRPKMLRTLRFRHQVARAAKDFLDREGFLSVETPMLTKSTPEGARDYLVPSRVHPGDFYALPQSPQIFKQLLMAGGIDRYYQFARCFRDEDLRADRQPEFTQVDMEMSFMDQEEILQFLERLFRQIFREALGAALPDPFPRLTWKEAMDVYGTDKPDLRFGLPIVDLTGIASGCRFSVFRKAADSGGVVRAINAKGCADFTRSEIEFLTHKALGYGAKGMAWIAVREDGERYSILTKYFDRAEMDALLQAVDGRPGDFILFCADTLPVVRRTLGGLRLDLADLRNLRRAGDFQPLFVTDFPQFEYSEEEKRYVATHHPFTMPYPEDVPYLLIDPGRVRAQAYDVVLNGIELGSGSIRIHDRTVQETMFEALGFTPEAARERFGFLINAFRYGTPPHGGFAFGLDRLVMQMLGAESLRDVIAFPKLGDGSCPLTGAPDVVDPAQLEILGLAGLPNGTAARTAAKAASPQPEINLDAVADLAQLTIPADEKEDLTHQLREIISFADDLAQIDTTGIPETAHVAELFNVFREDVPENPLSRELLLQNAPDQENGYLRVPRVVE